MKRLFKNSFISALLIGILATALWEKFISPFCTYIYIHISSLIEIFIKTFSNSTYKEISNGYDDSYSLYIIMIILLTYLGLMTILNFSYLFQKHIDKVIEKIEENDSPSKILNQLNKKTTFYKTIKNVFFFIFILCFLYIIGDLTFVNQCKTKSLCNIEIVSPYVSDIEYKQLKSTFYSIQTKDDYINFTENINEIGEKYALNLKK